MIVFVMTQVVKNENYIWRLTLKLCHMKKKNILLIFGLLPVLASCITKSLISETSGVNTSELNNIPNGAKEIIIERSGTAEELYNDLFTALLSRGHRIDKDDKERGYITTEGHDVGQSTTQRMTIVISEKDISAKANIITEWKAGTEAAMFASGLSGIQILSDWSKATWETGRPGIAFAESVAVAKKVVGGLISYK